MAKLQITMNNAPRNLGAFLPPPYAVTTPAASSQGVLEVRGYPGTMAVPSPAPTALNDGELGGPHNQSSRLAPDYILPSKYWAILKVRNSFPGFKIRSTNVAPVPAPYVARGSAQTQYRTRIGGRTVTRWPRQFVRFPNYQEVKR